MAANAHHYHIFQCDLTSSLLGIKWKIPGMCDTVHKEI